MPITKTAKKQLQVTRRNTLRNVNNRTVLKTAMKNARLAIEEGTDKEAATAALNHAVKTLHRSATRRIIKRQNASRRVGRLTVSFNKVFNPKEAAPAEAVE